MAELLNVTTQQRDKNQDILNRIKSMMAFRVIIAVTLLFVSFIYVYLNINKPDEPNNAVAYFFIMISGGMLFISVIYLTYFYFCTNMRFFAYIQLTIDLFIETVIIYVLGGSAGPFTILYLFTIVTASIILDGKNGLSFSFIATLLYLWLIFANRCDMKYPHLIGMLPYFPLQKSFLFYSLITNIGGFFLVGYLSNYITERLQQTDDLLEMHMNHYEDLRISLNHVVQSIQNGLMTIDLSGQIIFLNAEGERLLGVKESDIHGKDYESIVPSRVSRKVKRLLTESDVDMTFEEEVTYVANSTEVPLRFTITLVKDDARNCKGVLLIFQNQIRIHEMEFYKHTAEKWSNVAELAANIAHEIRNPLAAMTGSIELLRDNPNLDASDKRLMNVVLRESQRLNAMITDFLNFSRPMVLKCENRNMVTLLSGIIAMIEAAQSSEVSVRFFFEASEETINAYVDSERIKQVFWNLLKNSIEAMPDGGEIELSVRYKYLTSFSSTIIDANILLEESGESIDEGDSKYVWIRIKDSGIGIQQDKIKTIFNPFTSYKKTGTGLGLAISYRIIEAHAGYIAVQSVVGKGTLFHIILPTQRMRGISE